MKLTYKLLSILSNRALQNACVFFTWPKKPNCTRTVGGINHVDFINWNFNCVILLDHKNELILITLHKLERQRQRRKNVIFCCRYEKLSEIKIFFQFREKLALFKGIEFELIISWIFQVCTIYQEILSISNGNVMLIPSLLDKAKKNSRTNLFHLIEK